MLTYDRKNKSSVDIFNDFVSVTKIRISSEIMMDILKEIEYAQAIDDNEIILAAEIDNIIPQITNKIKIKKQ